jgi:glycerol-3-phosphate dehydrogenase
VKGFLTEIRDVLPGAGLTSADVEHAFAGLYPLTESEIRPDVYQGTGSYQIVDHGRLGHLDGIVSVLGAKYTTARRVAELAADLIVARLGSSARPCQTSTTPVVGGEIDDMTGFTETARSRHMTSIGDETVDHLVTHYGTEIDAVLACRGEDLHPTSRLTPNRECLEAEVAFAVEHEMAVRLDDVVLRRTGLGTIGHPGTAALERCASIMATRLAWSPAHARDEVARVEAMLRSWST